MHLSDCDEIVSGGAVGIDSCAAEYIKAQPKSAAPVFYFVLFFIAYCAALYASAAEAKL